MIHQEGMRVVWRTKSSTLELLLLMLGLDQASHTLLSQVKARLASCLLSSDKVLEAFVLLRGKQPETLAQEGRMRRVLLRVRRVAESGLV